MATTDVAEQFELVGVAHRGEEASFGRARRLRDGQLVWLEIPHTDTVRATERLRHELEVSRTLDRSAALRPVELSTFAHAPVLVLEDFGGTSLAELLATPIEIGDALQIASAIATSLVSIHQSGIVHRDISPQNILYEPRTGEARLAGFGIASSTHGETWALATRIEGSLPYMSPEQAGRLDRPVDARSDLYSLGVVMYEMLMASRPFEAHDVVGWVHCHVARLPLPPAVISPRVPLVISDLVMKLLAKLPEERYQTTAALAADLRCCVDAWHATGTVAPFTLASNDVSDQLRMPRKLYGRQAETTLLGNALRMVIARGVPHVVVMKGAAGAGKSSLARSLEESVVRMGGMFAAGTFAQNVQVSPYSAIARALHEVVSHIEYESPEGLATWRERFAEALGALEQLIVDLVPSLETIIGKQPAVPELPLVERTARFHLAVRRFVAALATTSNVLVLSLDDLQDADDSSLDLLAHLAGHSETGRVLLTCAYRDDGLPHPALQRFIENLRAGETLVDEIALAPLTLGDVMNLCADALSSTPLRTASLARIVWQRTGGNPLAVTLLMNELHTDGLLVFDPAERTWRWDRLLEEREGVVPSGLSRLEALAPAVREILELAACIGIEFDGGTLALIAGSSPAAALAEAVEVRLLSSIGSAYRFVHEAVHDAIYRAIPETRRAEVHARIGRLLLEQLPADELVRRVFELTRHLNRGISWLQDPGERARVAELELHAGRAAASSSAFASASAYFTTGIELLDAGAWQERFDLTFALHLELAYCELAQSHFPEVTALVSTLRSRVGSERRRRIVDRLEIETLLTQNDSAAAVAIAVESLAPLGIQLSPHPSNEDVLAAVRRLDEELAGRSIASLIELPLLADPGLITALDVLGAVLPSAYLTDPNLHAVVAAHSCMLSIRHGLTGASALGFASIALELEPMFHRPDDARDFAELAPRVVDKYGFTAFSGKVRMAVAFGAPRLGPLGDAIELQRLAHRAALDVGDLAYAAFSAVELVGLRIARGDPLDDVARDGSAMLREIGMPMIANVMRVHLAFAETLRGLTSSTSTFTSSELDETAFLAKGEANAPVVAGNLHARKLQTSWIHGDYSAALAEAEQLPPLLWALKGQLRLAEYHFFAALTHAALATEEQRTIHLEQLAQHQVALRDWARAWPPSFGYMTSLIDAERARLAGDVREAIHQFEQAIHAARDNGFTSGSAIAFERAASFYRELGLYDLAARYVAEARDHYAAWGAHAKVRALDTRYPRAAAAAPELITLLKTSQRISSEMLRPRLLTTLLQVLLEQAGARKAAFVSVNGNQWAVESFAGSTPDGPASIIDQVLRSRSSVLLHDAMQPGPYAGDPYLEQHHPRSVLCLPIVRHDELIGIVYLENDLVPGVFTSERTVVLGLLVEQAGISLENARLYADRGRQIAERQQAEATLRSVLDNIVDAVFVCDRTGRVTFTNLAGARFVGVRADEHPTALELAARIRACHPDGMPLAQNELPLLRALAGEVVSAVDVTVRDPHTERAQHLRVSAAPLQDEKGAIAGALAVAINVTEATELERLKDQFVRAVAHELKTPITIVKGYADVLRGMPGAIPESRRSVLDALVAGADRIDRLLTEVLILWQLQTGRLSLAVEPDIDLTEILANVLDRLPADRALRVSLHTPRPLLVAADQQLVDLAITNLVDNALRYSPPGSPVTVRAGRDGDRVYVAVTDHGIGIPREMQSRLFEPFFRAHADTSYDTGGLGLGLYTAKAIALLHAGSIDFDTEEGHGSTFRFAIPTQRRAA